MKNIKTVKMTMKQSDIEGGKNIDGAAGIKCNNCGGYGYTMKLGGGQLPCKDCQKTGVKELSREELQFQVYQLSQDIHDLRQALLKDLGFHNIKVPQAVRRENNE